MGTVSIRCSQILALRKDFDADDIHKDHAQFSIRLLNLEHSSVCVDTNCVTWYTCILLYIYVYVYLYVDNCIIYIYTYA